MHCIPSSLGGGNSNCNGIIIVNIQFLNIFSVACADNSFTIPKLKLK